DAQTPGHPGTEQIRRWHDTRPPHRPGARAGATSDSTVDEQASRPDTTPPRESPRWPAVLRAGRAFSRQIRLRQIRRSATQDFVFLLQQPSAFPQCLELLML